jgi:hypothetical protein
MRLKRANAGARACALVSFVVLVAATAAATALTPAPALALNPERHYEMVSPPYKAGYGISSIEAVAPDGESLAYEGQGAFAGTPRDGIFSDYLARREVSGWGTSSQEPPASFLPGSNVTDFTPTLSVGLTSGCATPNFLTSEVICHQDYFFQHNVDAPDLPENWLQFGQPLEFLNQDNVVGHIFYRGASSDLCHLLVVGDKPITAEAAAGTINERTYETDSGCDGESSVKPLGLDNAEPTPRLIDPYCHDYPGGFREHDSGSHFNQLSSSGEEAFFTAFVEPASEERYCGNYNETLANPVQVFVRLGASRTVEVSRKLEPGPFNGCSKGGVPGEVPCEGASSRAPSLFWGASEDGSTVFFSTAAQLVAGDTDTSQNLYMARIGCPPDEEPCPISSREVTSLVRVSQSPIAGEQAAVQGVVRVAPDGAHAYFVARGILSSEAGPEGRLPLREADNLYAYDAATGRVAFVGDLCSGPLQSGAVEDVGCPASLSIGVERNDASLWAQQSEDGEAQVNVCGRPSASECVGERETGRFLVFSTFGRLLRHDTDNAKDVYRYDTRTGSLVRVSSGEESADGNGNCNDSAGESNCDATIVPRVRQGNTEFLKTEHEMNDRSISEDGSRIVFSTAAPLSAGATNGVADVYEWHGASGEAAEGSVSMVSSGVSPAPDLDPVIDSSGRDIFFITTSGLVSQDTDGLYDVYDARLGGGFAVQSLGPERCEGEGCYGPLTNPAPLLVPGSVPQAPGGNLTASAKPAIKAKKAKPKRKKKPNTRKKKAKAKAKRSRVSRGRNPRRAGHGRGVR